MSRPFRSLAFADALFAAFPAAALPGEPGDRINGATVIEKLDVATLSAGKTRLWLRVDDNDVGQRYYVPIVVVQGA